MSCFRLVPVATVLTGGEVTKGDEDAANDAEAREEVIAKGGAELVDEELVAAIGGGLIKNGEGPCEVGAAALKSWRAE